MVNKYKALLTHIQLVQNICKYIAEKPEPPSLTELSKQYGLSQYYLQRIFKRIVGITPKQYAEQQRYQRFKNQLKSNQSITDALYQSGYASSSAFYTKASSELGMTPNNYKNGSVDILIHYSISNSPLGKLLAASTNKGICMVSLADEEELLINALQNEFPKAILQRDNTYLSEQINTLLEYIKGEEPHCDLPLDIRGTAFQKRVWNELKKIDYGSTCTYEQIAERIGKPKAVRAVANACANNPTSLIVPCHRVIRKDGNLGGYRWDLKRKKALLEMETSNVKASSSAF